MRNARPLLGLLLTAVVLAAVLVVVLRPFTPAVADGGPLGPEDNPGSMCVPGRLGHGDTDGFESYTNSGPGTVVIDRVSVASSRNLKIIGGYALPGRAAVGVWTRFPPPVRQLPKGVQWSKRQPIPGTRVAPHQWVNLAIGLVPMRDAPGTSAGIVVWYHDGSQHYARRSNIRIVIKLPPGHCN